MLSWMIEIWMKNHLVSDSNRNTVNLCNPWKYWQGMINNVGLTFSVVTLHLGLQLVLSKTIRIGDTKYRFWCSVLKSIGNTILAERSVWFEVWKCVQIYHDQTVFFLSDLTFYWHTCDLLLLVAGWIIMNYFLSRRLNSSSQETNHNEAIYNL